MIHALLLGSMTLPLLPAGDARPCAGAYVEARTASVYAGACHYNDEVVAGGREALCAWRIESGAFAGVDLAGIAIAAVVVSDANLDQRSTMRRSSIRVDAGDGSPRDAARAAAAVRWLATTRADVLGDVVAVECAPLTVAIDGARYAVDAPGAFELAGAPMPDRACCSMPQNVWYAPLETLERPLVGLDAKFSVRADELGRAWSRPDENAAFTGRFDDAGVGGERALRAACGAARGPVRNPG